MKKEIFMKTLFFAILFLLSGSFLFAEGPTSAQIQKYAAELGIPASELQALVNKYNAGNSGLKDRRAINAQITDIAEANFLESNKGLTIGKFYRISCLYNQITGNTIHLLSGRGGGDMFSVKTDNLIRMEQYTPVEILLECVKNTGYDSFKLVEIVKR